MPNVSTTRAMADREKTASIVKDIVLGKFEDKKGKKEKNADIATIRLRRHESFRSAISKPVLLRCTSPLALRPPENEPTIKNWEIPEIPPFKSVSINRVKHFSGNGKKTDETENQVVIELYNWKDAKAPKGKGKKGGRKSDKGDKSKDKKKGSSDKENKVQNGNANAMTMGREQEGKTKQRKGLKNGTATL